MGFRRSRSSCCDFAECNTGGSGRGEIGKSKRFIK